MAEAPKQENFEEQPEKEQSLEEILASLERAFENATKAELTILEPDGTMKTNEVLIEGLENGVLFVSASESSPIMPVEISNIKKVK